MNVDNTQQYLINTVADTLAELTASPPSATAVLAVLQAAKIELPASVVTKCLEVWHEEVEKRMLDPFYTPNELVLALRTLIAETWDLARASALNDLQKLNPKIERLSDELYELEERLQNTFEGLQEIISHETDGWTALLGNQRIHELLEPLEKIITTLDKE